MKKKKISDSRTEMTMIVLPDDANTLGYLRGGKLVDWMDIAAEIAMQKFSNHMALTVSIDQVSFKKPIKVGDVISIIAKITKVFHSSAEVKVEVHSGNYRRTDGLIKTNEAYFVFVGIDEEGKSVVLPDGIPQSDDELDEFQMASKKKNKTRRMTSIKV